MFLPDPETKRNATAFFGSTLLMVAWVEGCKWLAHHDLLTRTLRRKLVHVFSGPLFVATWPWFSSSGNCFAALVPSVMTLNFVLIGLGIVKDRDTIETLSRRGDRSDILKGPLYYGFVFIISTYFYFKDIRGVIALMCLCFGDGNAEIFGRLYGENLKLPWSKEKSWPGLIAFVVASITSSLIMVIILVALDISFEVSSMTFLFRRIAFSSAIAAIIESVTCSDADNVAIFCAAMLADKYICDYMY